MTKKEAPKKTPETSTPAPKRGALKKASDWLFGKKTPVGRVDYSKLKSFQLQRPAKSRLSAIKTPGRLGGLGGGLAGGAVVMGALDQGGQFIDNRTLRTARDIDNVSIQAVLEPLEEANAQLQNRLQLLTPEQLAVYRRNLQELKGQRVHVGTENPIFNAKQDIAVSTLAYLRAVDKATKVPPDAMRRWESKVNLYRRNNAVEKETIGSTEEQKFRDTGLGTLTGAMAGRVDPDSLGPVGSVAAKIWRALNSPLVTAGRAIEGRPLFPVEDPGLKYGGGPLPQETAIDRAVNSVPAFDQRPSLTGAKKDAAVGKPKGFQGDEQKPTLRTFEEITRDALERAGFGPENMARAAGYTSTWQGLTGGNQAATNPYLGGREASLEDVRGYRQGTHSQQRAYAQMMRERSDKLMDYKQAALDRAAAMYAAQQRGEAVGQAATLKDRNTLLKEAGMNYRAVVQGIAKRAAQENLAGPDKRALEEELARENAKYANLLRQYTPEEEIASGLGGG